MSVHDMTSLVPVRRYRLQYTCFHYSYVSTFTYNSTKLASVLIIAYNSKIHFVQNDPFCQTRSHTSLLDNKSMKVVKAGQTYLPSGHGGMQVQPAGNYIERIPPSHK